MAHHEPLGIAGWRWLSFFPSLGVLLAWLLRHGLPESPRWLAEHRRSQDVAPSTSGDTSFMRLWRPPLRRWVLLLMVGNAASTVAFYSFVNWLPSLLLAQGVPIQGIFMYTAAIGLTYPLASALAILFADRVERKWLIVTTAALSAVLGLLLRTDRRSPVGGLRSSPCSFQPDEGHRRARVPKRAISNGLRARAVGLIYSFTRITAA